MFSHLGGSNYEIEVKVIPDTAPDAFVNIYTYIISLYAPFCLAVMIYLYMLRMI